MPEQTAEIKTERMPAAEAPPNSPSILNALHDGDKDQAPHIPSLVDSKPTLETDQQAIDRAKQLKKLWMTQDHAMLTSVAGLQVQELMEQVEEEILKSPIYVTSPEGKKIVRESKDIREDAQLLIEKVQATPSLLPEGIPPKQVVQVIHEYLDFLGDRKVHTSKGIDGVIDVLNDGFIFQQVIAKRIADRPEFDLRKTVLPTLPSAERMAIEGFFAVGLDDQAGKAILESLPEEEQMAYQTNLDRAEAEESVKNFKMLEAVSETTRIFSFEEIDGSNPEALPLEIQYLLTQDPKYEQILQGLQSQGVSLRLQRINTTPPDVLHAISRVAVSSQENFIHTWLPDLIKNGRTPRLAPTENGLRRAKELGLVEEDEIIDSQVLESDIKTISQSMHEFLSIKATSSEPLDEDTQQLVEVLSEGLHGSRKEYALNKMTFDNADERTGEAQEIIKKMMFIGPIAHGLELADLGALAKLFASSSDDLMGEWAEMKALMGSGFSRKELLKRGKVLAPVFGAATYAATKVESLLHQDKELQAGALFGASAVALSLTTSIQSMRMYYRAYSELVRQGKIPERSQIPDSVVKTLGNPDFKRSFSQLEESHELLDPSRQEELFELIKNHLQEVSLPEEDVEEIMSALESVDSEQVSQLMQKPRLLESVKHAIKQDFSNPARLGILLGASVAPFVGVAGAELGGLNNGFVMAGIGSVESILAGATVIAAKRLNKFKYKLRLKKKIKE